MPWPDFVTSDSEPCRDDASMADRVHLAMFGQAPGAVEKRPEPPKVVELLQAWGLERVKHPATSVELRLETRGWLYLSGCGLFPTLFGHGKRIEGSVIDIRVVRREVDLTRDHHPRPPGRLELPRQPGLRFLTSRE